MAKKNKVKTEKTPKVKSFTAKATTYLTAKIGAKKFEHQKGDEFKVTESEYATLFGAGLVE